MTHDTFFTSPYSAALHSTQHHKTFLTRLHARKQNNTTHSCTILFSLHFALPHQTPQDRTSPHSTSHNITFGTKLYFTADHITVLYETLMFFRIFYFFPFNHRKLSKVPTFIYSKTSDSRTSSGIF